MNFFFFCLQHSTYMAIIMAVANSPVSVQILEFEFHIAVYFLALNWCNELLVFVSIHLIISFFFFWLHIRIRVVLMPLTSFLFSIMDSTSEVHLHCSTKKIEFSYDILFIFQSIRAKYLHNKNSQSNYLFKWFPSIWYTKAIYNFNNQAYSVIIRATIMNHFSP